jgi:tetratricopeptide (TPR) repeat protein
VRTISGSLPEAVSNPGEVVLRVLVLIVALACAGIAQASDKPRFAPPGSWVKPLPVPTIAPKPDDTGPVRTLLSNMQVNLGDQGVAVYYHAALRFQTPAGLGAANLAITWNPDTEDIVVHQVRILRGQEVIDLLAKGQSFAVLRRETDLERAMLNGALTATLQPEGLQVGDVLDVAYTLERHDPVLGQHREAILAVSPKATIGKLQFRVVWPASKGVRWRETDGLTTASMAKDERQSALLVEEDNAQRPEPPKSAPARFNYLSVLEASDFANWAEISDLMAPLYAKAATLAPGSPLRAEAARIRSGSADPKVQAAAALRLVQDQVRYLFLGMNQGGYVPADADLTWSRRFGDCKGKTALLLALLHELGIDAEPALVSTVVGDGLNERLPILEAFDHVIVHATIGGASYWLDGTRSGDRALDDIAVPPFGWALPVRDRGADLVRLAQRPLDAPLVQTSIHLDASAGLDAVAPAHLETTFRGDLGDAMRLGLAAKSPSDVDKALRDYWGAVYPWIEISSVSASFDDLKRTERLTMDGAAKMEWDLNANFGARQYDADGAQLGEGFDFKRDPGPHSDAPYAIAFPTYTRMAETIVLPQGGKGFTVVGDDVEKTIAGFELKRTSHIDAGVFSMVATSRSIVPEILASEVGPAKIALRAIADVEVHVRAPAGYADGEHEAHLRLARTPTLASEFADRAEARVLKADYRAAVQDYDEAIKLKPDDAELLNSRCFTRSIANLDLTHAMDDCNAALDLQPRNPAYLDSRGFLYFRMGDPKKALADFNTAIEIDPKQSPTLYVRGLIERRMGDGVHADADIGAAKTIDPTVVATYARYGVGP